MLDALLQLDGQLLLAIQSMHQPWLDPIVSGFTKLGDAGLLWIAVSIGLLIPKSTRKAGMAALFAMILGLLVTNLTIKPLVERPRPWLDWPIRPLVTENDPNSFPSGHTCAAFAAALSWAWALPGRRKGWLTIALAVCMGLSRLYVGVHYPTDVLAGAIIGCLCAWAVQRVYRILEEKKSRVY